MAKVSIFLFFSCANVMFFFVFYFSAFFFVPKKISDKIIKGGD